MSPFARLQAPGWSSIVVALAVLALGLFNLTFRLGREAVQEWDEALYATTAWEALSLGNWIGTTFHGALDYYNTKPPLNVWLIAIAFKVFGPSLVSLRLVSVVSAFLTIVVLQRWTLRHLGPAVSVLSSLVLATTFGFLHIHSGRTANTDPLFTLLILLTAVVLVSEEGHRWRRLWLGPILAAAFLLRGTAVLMPLAIVAVADLVSYRTTARRLVPSAAALVLGLAPAGAWAWARYQVDGWEFFRRMAGYDFVSRSTQVLEGHAGGLLYYVNILHRNHFEWVAIGLLALIIAPIPWDTVRARLRGWHTCRLHVVLAAWGLVALGVPTLMQTKLPWYLNSFYPVFAIGVAVLLSRAFVRVARSPSSWRLPAVAAIVITLAATAEARLFWYSLERRDLRHSGQSLLLAERDQMRGRRVFQDEFRRGVMFVASAMVGAEPQVHPVDLCCVGRETAPGDYLLTATPIAAAEFRLVRFNAVRWLYLRVQTGREF